MKKIKRYFILFLSIILLTIFFNQAHTLAHSPHDDIEDIAISNSYDRDNTLIISVRNNLLKSTDRGKSWIRVNNGLNNRYKISSLVSAKGQNNSFFISTNGDGIFKSENNGNSWFKTNNGIDNLSIDFLAISPNSTKKMLAVGHDKGIYISNNAGQAWKRIKFFDAIKISSIEYLPNNSDSFIAGDVSGNIYYPILDTTAWEKVNVLNDSITAISISHSYKKDKKMFIGTNSHGLYTTNDMNRSFSRVNNPTLSKSSIKDILVDESGGKHMTYVSTKYSGIFRSKDNGNTWDECINGLTTHQQAKMLNRPNFSRLISSPNYSYDKTLYLAGFNGLFRSKNECLSWEEISTLSPNIIVGLSISPNFEKDSTIAIATYLNGTYISRNRGTSWEKIKNYNNKIIRPFDLLFSPDYMHDGTIFSLETNKLLRSTDFGKTWDEISIKQSNFFVDIIRYILKKPEIRHPVIIVSSPIISEDKILFIGTLDGSIFKSSQRGNKSKLISKINGKLISLKISPNFSSDNTLFAGTAYQGVSVSSDGGLTWNSANRGLPVNQLDESVYLAISPNYEFDNTLFLGTSSGLYISKSKNIKWEKVQILSNKENSYIDAISLSPNYRDDKTILVSVRGEGLFKSTDSATSFFQDDLNLLKSNNIFANMNGFSPMSNPIVFSKSYSRDRTIVATTGKKLFMTNITRKGWREIPFEFSELDFRLNRKKERSTIED